MSQTDKQYLFLQDVARLINRAKKKKDITLTGGDLYRTPERQADLVARGKSWTKNGYHPKRQAVDFNIFIDVPQKSGKPKREFATFEIAKFLGDYFESLDAHNIWGGYFPGKQQDIWHFERRDGERKVRL